MVSYTIFKDPSGNNYYAQASSESGLPDLRDPDAATVINDALVGLTPGRTWKEKIIIEGIIPIYSPISVPSYTILEVQGTLRLANGADCDVIHNADATHSNSNIEIFGGEIDGNESNQQGAPSAAIRGIALGNVTDSSIHDVYVHDVYYQAIQLRGQRISLSDFNVVQPNKIPRLGVMIIDSSFVTVENGKSIGGDDALALSADARDETDVTASNLQLFSYKAHGIRINQSDRSVAAGETRFHKNHNFSNITIYGDNDPNGGCLQICPFYSDVSFFQDSIFDNLTIHDASGSGIYFSNCRRLRFTNLQMRNVAGHGLDMSPANISDVEISNFTLYDTAKTTAGTHAIVVGGPSTPATGIKLLNGLIDTTTVANAMGVRLRNCTNVEVNGVTLKNLADWGIYEVSPSDYNIIEGNDVSALTNKIHRSGSER